VPPHNPDHVMVDLWVPWTNKEVAARRSTRARCVTAGYRAVLGRHDSVICKTPRFRNRRPLTRGRKVVGKDSLMCQQVRQAV
jgi:hypothetical protein